MTTMITTRPAALMSQGESAFVLPAFATLVRVRPQASIAAAMLAAAGTTAAATTGHLGYAPAVATGARVRDAKQAAPPRGSSC